MDIVIDKDCINLMIIPLDDEDAISLEEHLHRTVVQKRAKNEFVVVLADSLYPSMISYGLCEADRYDELARLEIEEWIVSNGREWMRNNNFIIYN